MRKQLLSLLALVPVLSSASAQTFSGGDGSQASPYLIRTKADVSELSTAVINGNTFAGKYFRLENDIAYTSADEFTPIGYTDKVTPKKFGGNFNGNSHTLSGISITGTYYAGVFCYLDAGGSITDLNLDNIKVTSTNSNGGTLVAKSDGEIARVKATNIDFNSTNGGYKGGLVGFVNKGKVEDCYLSGSVMATGSVGGIVGQNYGAISNCHSNATIVVQGEGSSSAHIGGVASITLTLSGEQASITDSYFTGSIQAAPLNNCGGITSTLNVGNIERCWNGGYIASSGNTGGLVATFNAGKISDCYNAGTIVGSGEASGGLIGLASDSNKKGLELNRCLNTGSIMFSAISRKDGCELVGSGIDQVKITDCWYDSQMSGYTKSERALTTAALTDGTTLQNFGAEWTFATGLYPRLASTAASDGALLNAAPVLLASGEDHLHIKSPFALSQAVPDLEWDMTGGTACSLNGYAVSVTRTASKQNLVLTSYLGDYQKRTLVSVYPSIFQGEGTAEFPYLISGPDDMLKLSEAINTQLLDFTDEYLTLTADIDMAGVTDFMPFGFSGNAGATFNGTLAANGHSIKNLSIDSRTNSVMNIGLFTSIAPKGTVRGLVIDKSCRFVAYRNFAPIAAVLYGTIEDCRNYADVPTTDGYAAGIAAFSYGGTIRRCLNAGTISSSAKNGNLAGIVCSGYDGTTVEECQNAGVITATHDKAAGLGGICGSMYGTIENCLNTGAIVGDTNSSTIGGLAASDNASCEIRSSLSLAPITAGSYNNIGSAVGNSRGTYSNVYADAQITVYDNPQPGISMLPTAALTGSSLEGFGTEWSFSQGRYPMLDIFKSLPEALIGSMPVLLPDGIYRNEISGTATLYHDRDLTWSVDGDVFAIDGDKLICPSVQQYSTATLTAEYAGHTRRIPVGAMPDLFNGEGTQDSPWQINTPADLKKLSEVTGNSNLSFNGRHFTVTSDLDMSGITGFAPICANGKFQGSLAGSGHTIDNISIKSDNSPAGLFGTIGSNGAVFGLVMGAGSTISGNGSTGAFAATLEGRLSNCVNNASVSSASSIIGGMAGTVLGNAVMENLTNNADIETPQSKAGGIAGTVTSATVTARNLVNNGNISSKANYVAGIVGYCTGITIIRASNNGDITTSASDAAGIIGYTTEATVLDGCVNYGAVSAKTEAAGIVACATKALMLTSSFNAGDISVTSQTAGGLIASADKPEISRCVNFGPVTNSNASLGSTYAGAAGIVAKANPIVTDCANFGTVSAKDNAGSVMAYYKSSYTPCTITNFYNVGRVSATGTAPKAVNMFVGKEGKVTYANCVYDNQALPGYSDDNGLTTAALLATDFGDNFTDTAYGYPMPLGTEDYEVSRLYRTALLFTVDTDNYGKVSDSCRIKADPWVSFESNDIFTVTTGNLVTVREYTKGDYTLASSLGDAQRLITLHVDSGKSGIEDAVAAETVSVEYFTVDGIRVTEPAPGAGMLIRRATGADGKITVDKVFIR